jgi:hypothetical protein
LAGRIYLANVGANASHRFAGPIFADGTFEFLPIPEDRDLPGDHAVRYRDLTSYNEPGADLLRYVPERLWRWPAHSDPEFETFTYGDNCATSPRAAALKRMEWGDRLLFLARLERWADAGPTGEFGFYLVGFLEIDEVLEDVTSCPDGGVLERFGANAHVRRGLSDPALWDRFWAFRGSGRSRRFHRAVPVTRALASEVFTAADGRPWRWDRGRSDLQVIGSYTRSCRCVIDPAVAGHQARAETLWEWIARHG